MRKINFQKWHAYFINIINQPINSVYGLFHEMDDINVTNPQEIQLSFNNACITLYGGSDGATICIKDRQTLEVDLGEYGKLVPKEISGHQIIKDVLNHDLLYIYLINSNMEQTTIGLKFAFSAKKTLSIINFGDEIYFFNEIPLNILNEEGITFE